MTTACAHADVRYCEGEFGAVACFVCGRLFGRLRPDGTFVSHNPPPVAVALTNFQPQREDS